LELGIDDLVFLQAGREELRQRILQAYRQTAKREHVALLRRRQIIEDRKEEIENINYMRVSYVLIL
jgi:hypothetical protein